MLTEQKGEYCRMLWNVRTHRRKEHFQILRADQKKDRFQMLVDRKDLSVSKIVSAMKRMDHGCILGCEKQKGVRYPDDRSLIDI